MSSKLKKVHGWSKKQNHGINFKRPKIDIKEEIKEEITSYSINIGKVLVIIPTYNSEKTILDSVNSVLNQTYQDLLVVVVDDCSTDRTYEILNSIKDTRVKVLKNNKNLGTYRSINIGLYFGSDLGFDYFCIHDSDDLMLPDKLEFQLGFFDLDVNTKGVSCGYNRVDFNTKKVVSTYSFCENTTLYKREVFDILGYYDDTRYGGDSEYFNRFTLCFGSEASMKTGKILSNCYYVDRKNLTISVPSSDRFAYVRRYKEDHGRMSKSRRFFRNSQSTISEDFSVVFNKSPRIVVFTENIGDYDNLRPTKKFDNTKCIAFLDRDIEIDGWEVINISKFPHITKLKNTKLICKYIRTHPHELLPNHDYSLHIDANMMLTEDPNKIVGEIVESKKEILVFRHHKRNSIYEEGAQCIESKLDSESRISDQLEKYRKFGIGSGLYECGLMLRKNTKRVQNFNNIWWEEILRYSSRDQIAFPYSISKAGVSIGTFKIEDRRKSILIKVDTDKRGNYIPTPHKKSRVFNNNLCFVYDEGRGNWGSTKMRGRDISEKIGCNIVSFNESNKIKYKKIVLLKMSNYEKALPLTEFNEVICDMVDFDQSKHNLNTFKSFDYGIFTSVRQMEELRHIFKSPEKCKVIYHHWDERFSNISIHDGISSPRICYIGQPEKCYGKNSNIERHSIDWYDFDEKISLYEHYNVHYAVKPKGEDDKIQPLTKISTAASLGCPVIANRSAHNIEMLGSDYPYYCDPNDESVDNVIKKIYSTFGKAEWNIALKKMKEIKEKTSLKRIIKNYLDLGYRSQKEDISVKGMRIYGFYFVALINDWKSIVVEQMERLFNSNLMKDTNVLFLRVYYKVDSDLEDFNKIIDSYKKNFNVDIRIHLTNQNEYEFGILNQIKEMASKDEFYCYYLHTKGVSKIKDARRIEPIRAWRRYMEHYLIDDYSSCIESLKDGYDAVGVKIRETPSSMESVSGSTDKFWWSTSEYKSRYKRNPKHFSGNFWWSKSSYIKSLPDIDRIRIGDRHEAEFWIGYSDGELKCLHYGDSAGYSNVIKEKEYMNADSIQNHI